MFDPHVVKNLKQRYNTIHPLIFKRSMEKSKSLGELFDILEDLPSNYPVKWCENTRKWVYFKNYFDVVPFMEKHVNGKM